MARQVQAAEVNTFIKGFITEASPLTFPANATIDEVNMVLNRDGSRHRRLGMDYELTYNIRQVLNTNADAAVTSFNWEDASGNAGKILFVFQIGTYLMFFDNDAATISAGIIHTHTFTSMDDRTRMDYTEVGGLLVVTTGEHDIATFEYDVAAGTVSQTAHQLHVRDVWGVDDGLLDQEDILTRPATLTDSHVYNLRNQTWAIPRMYHGGALLVDDPIERLFLENSKYPSNSDSMFYAFYPDANDATDRLSDRFNAGDLDRNPSGNAHAPQGHFIIDALRRGASRISQINGLHTSHPTLSYQPASLPTDLTEGGASTVAEWAGRVWYAGFTGALTNGDDKSPHLESYVFFSRLVQNFSDIAECYTAGDPCSREGADIVATDGGFIRIENAHNIMRMVNIGQSLIVMASNGIWRITGGTEQGFSATTYIIEKISQHGVDSRDSVVEFDNTIFYWSNDGIYHLAPNDFGDYSAQNITQATIQTHFDAISPLRRYECIGIADHYERKIHWVYNNHLELTGDTIELILDLNLQAFSINHIGTTLGASEYPRVMCPFIVPPFKVGSEDIDITANGVLVEANSVQVVYSRDAQVSGQRELAYLVATDLDSVTGTSYTFASYHDQDFTDWISSDSVGVDALAYMLTGWEGAGDYQRYKQIPYLTMHFRRTETGFEDLLSDGNLTPKDESSCLVQAQWEWADHVNSGRWGTEFEAYRYRRVYQPLNVSDPYETGFDLISTKNRIRGKGRVFSFKMTSTPKKDMNILGWSMAIGSNTNV